MTLLFAKRKFLKLDLPQQHKKCAELLRSIYENILQRNPLENHFDSYHTLLSWMKLDTFSTLDLKELSDRYHWHLENASRLLKEHNLLPHLRTGDSQPKKDFAPCAIYLDNLRSAYNVGSILRTTEALRIGSVHFAKKTPFIDNPKVEKISMGTSQIVPCFQHTDLKTLPRPIIVVDTSNEAISAHTFLFPPLFTLVLGNEEYGVSDESLSQADLIIEIPLLGMKNSINVACAFSSIAFEISRQKSLYKE